MLSQMSQQRALNNTSINVNVLVCMQIVSNADASWRLPAWSGFDTLSHYGRTENDNNQLHRSSLLKAWLPTGTS